MAILRSRQPRSQEALRARAEAEGISLQEAARRAVREFVARSDHRDRVSHAAERVAETHSDALRRLGKRLGGLCTAVFLEINGIEISLANNDNMYDLVVHVAAGHPTVEEIAERLQQLTA